MGDYVQEFAKSVCGSFQSTILYWSALRRLERVKGESDPANGTVQLGLDGMRMNKEGSESGRERQVRCQWWEMIKEMIKKKGHSVFH